jgi:hypothetical protein
MIDNVKTGPDLQTYQQWAAERKAALPPVRSDSLFDVLIAIVNTAQLNPDRCMADVCNDNFAVHGINLRAEWTDDEDNPVRIDETPNAPADLPAVAGKVRRDVGCREDPR